jgi:hypothetical protein
MPDGMCFSFQVFNVFPFGKANLLFFSTCTISHVTQAPPKLLFSNSYSLDWYLFKSAVSQQHGYFNLANIFWLLPEGMPTSLLGLNQLADWMKMNAEHWFLSLPQS